ncbi:MFS transporter [Halorhabdus salina]|uniref:MFS transporter n=1 Tax=Halorhabdus salina TaxID=2750670 RepID=UPI00215DA55C|nr:MFS transporter [Halorhabdus salina]
MTSFESHFVVGKGLLGFVTPAGTVGFVAAMLWVGPASGRLDLRRYLLFGTGLTAVSLLGLALIGDGRLFSVSGVAQSGDRALFGLFLAFIAVRSLGTGVFRALDRPALSHLFPEGRSRIFSLQEMTWAIGATTGPLLVVGLTEYLGLAWQATYVVLASLCAPVFVLLWRLDSPDGSDNEDSFGLRDIRSVLSQPSVYGMALALVVVGGIESGFFTWLAIYADETATISGNLANLTLSIYLAAYVPGRLTFSYLTERFRFTHFLIGISAILLALLYIAFVHASGPAFLALIFVIGYFISGLFPTLISMGIEANPSFTGPVNAIANIAAQAGFFTVPVIIGVVAARTTLQTAMLLQIVLAALLAMILIALRLGPLRTEKAETHGTGT